ncbi:fungal pheromone STE3G-protein-coupled receptor, partial [Exidia glandulosa HHB12029]
MVDSTYVGITSVAIFCVLVPSIWHFSAWNTATCYMMMWTTIGCIIHIVDGSIWYHNIHFPSEHEKIWCDIAAKLIIGLSVAIPLSSLCINRRLYNIAAVKTITVNKESKMRDALIDTIIAVVLPIIFMVVHYTMQGHRFDIIEDFGCWPSTYLTAPGYALIIAPPIVVSAVSLVFCTLSIRAFWHRRSEFNELLRSHSTGLTSSRYFRLMALASAEIIVGLPFAIFFFVVGIKHNGVAPWISWDDTHYNFSRIDYYVTYQLKRAGPGVYVSYQMSRWAFPFTAFIFFAFFGFAAEARKNYRMAFFRVLAPFGIK